MSEEKIVRVHIFLPLRNNVKLWGNEIGLCFDWKLYTLLYIWRHFDVSTMI